MNPKFSINRVTNIFVILFFVFSTSLVYTQEVSPNTESDIEDENFDDAEIITLEESHIKVDPVRPFIELKRREIPPKDYTFFRSFEKEVQQVPNDLLRVKFNTDENRVDDLKKILSKQRK